MLASFFAALRAGWWLRGTLLAPIGREFLKIFLLSPLVWQVFWIFGGRNMDVETNFYKMVLVVSSFVGTMAVTFAPARIISNTFLASLLFPKKPLEWGGLMRRKRY